MRFSVSKYLEVVISVISECPYRAYSILLSYFLEYHSVYPSWNLVLSGSSLYYLGMCSEETTHTRFCEESVLWDWILWVFSGTYEPCITTKTDTNFSKCPFHKDKFVVTSPTLLWSSSLILWMLVKMAAFASMSNGKIQQICNEVNASACNSNRFLYQSFQRLSPKLTCKTQNIISYSQKYGNT